MQQISNSSEENQPKQDLISQLEAILFTCSEPVPLERLSEALCSGQEEETLEGLQGLQSRLRRRASALLLESVAGGWRLVTRPEYSELLEDFHRRTHRVRLTRASLETASIIAYLQPIATPEVESIRGVSVQQTVRSLIDYGFIEVVGRKNSPGRPFLYATTEKFLEHFGLKTLDDLPHVPELEKWKKEFKSGSPEQDSDPAEPVKTSSEPEESASTEEE